MEKLQRRSDGIAETLSGLFAVAPLRSSGKDEQFKWFDFRKTAVSQVIRVRWPIDDDIAVIEAGIANFMLNKGYARQINDRQLNDWNEAIDALELDAPNPAPVPIAEPTVELLGQADGDDGKPKQEQAQEPAGAQTQPQATQAPTGQQTAPEGLENAANGTAAPQGTATGNQPPVEGAENGETGPKDGEQGADGTNSEGATETTEETGNSTESDEKDEDDTDSAGEKPKGKKKATKGLL